MRISTGCYTCYHWLPARLVELRRQFPGIEVQVAADYTRRPLEGLLDDAVDLAIVSDPVRQSTLWPVPLFRDELLVVMAADHPLSRRASVSAPLLAAETLILYNVPPAQLSVYRDVLRPARVQPREIIRIELTEAIIELVRAGLGVACLARWAVAPYLRDGRLATARLTRQGYYRQWRAVIRRRERDTPHLKAFIDLLRDTPL
jgi:LysR family transcriptional regulator for metE and metH